MGYPPLPPQPPIGSSRPSPKPQSTRKKKRFADGVIAFGFIFLTLFTVVMTVGFFVTQTEPGTLITAVYAFWGAELCGLLVKRIAEKKFKEEP